MQPKLKLKPNRIFGFGSRFSRLPFFGALSHRTETANNIEYNFISSNSRALVIC